MLRQLHHLWAVIPQPVRQSFFYAAVRLTAPHASPLAEIHPGPVTVVGLLSTATGLGQGARLQLQAFQKMGLETRHVDLSAAFVQHHIPDLDFGQAARPDEGGVLIVHVNGPYLPYALSCLGRKLVRGRYVIANWAWELPAIPSSWVPAIGYVHEIWACSSFTADAIRQKSNKPVSVVPYPATLSMPSDIHPLPLAATDERLIVLTMFDMGSTFSRKNPLAAVEAFKQAFGDRADVVLVVKVTRPQSAPEAARALRDHVAGHTNIVIIDRLLTGGEVWGLIDRADIVLSLHRAEGFGLLAAEAMLLGKPVIATGWSGNLDFMNKDNSILVGYRLIPVDDPQGTYVIPEHWAEADSGEAAAALQRIADNPAERQRLGAAAQRDARLMFGIDGFAKHLSSNFWRAIVPPGRETA